MIQPDLPDDEKQRLEALLSYKILDTLPEEEYDSITRIASEICGTPISLITLIDDKRQWFKSNHGLSVTETAREISFCAHSILDPKNTLVVENSFEDNRFKDNPLATGNPHVEFYAGVPLVNPEGFPLGSLCVIDHEPRKITEQQMKSLRALADQVVQLLELRKTVIQLESTQQQLLRSNKNLEEFALIISHDLKAPLRNIRQLSQILTEDCEEKLNSKEKKYLNLLNQSAKESVNFIEGVLKYSKATHFFEKDTQDIDLNTFLEDLLKKLAPPPHLKIHIPDELPTIRTFKVAFHQIMRNLISNAIKYNDKKEGWIKLEFSEDESLYKFSISDNGRGIPAKKLDNIFALFYMVNNQDSENKNSSGIGLSIVRKLVHLLGGKINVSSELNAGTRFDFSLKRYK